MEVKFSILDLLDLDTKIKNYLSLECVSGRKGLDNLIAHPKVNRPGLALTGYFKEFSGNALQLLGHGEESYIEGLEKSENLDSIKKLFTYPIPAIIFAESYTPPRLFIELSEKNNIPVLITPLDSTDFTRRLYSVLDEVFAKSEVIHGVLVEVFGIGVLLRGESGIGKSEAALELVERGHRLISDDSVKITNLADSVIIGSWTNPLLAYRMEIRGIGIIDLKTLYGVGAVRERKQVQLVVNLENWNSGKNYDRLGSENEFTSLLGVRIPTVTIPVKAGKSIPIFIETAAKNERLKILGYHSGLEFDKDVTKWMERETAKAFYIDEDKS